jgi:hypothetical protein
MQSLCHFQSLRQYKPVIIRHRHSYSPGAIFESIGFWQRRTGANVITFNDIWTKISSSFSSIADASSDATSLTAASDSTGGGTPSDDRSSSFSDPSPFNGFGVAACDIQCAAESSSCTPSFSSVTTDTWGSAGSSSSSGSGFDW